MGQSLANCHGVTMWELTEPGVRYMCDLQDLCSIHQFVSSKSSVVERNT